MLNEVLFPRRVVEAQEGISHTLRFRNVDTHEIIQPNLTDISLSICLSLDDVEYSFATPPVQYADELELLTHCGVDITPASIIPYSADAYDRAVRLEIITNTAANDIARTTRRGAGNVIVGHPTMIEQMTKRDYVQHVSLEHMPEDTVIVGYVSRVAGPISFSDVGILRVHYEGQDLYKFDAVARNYYRIITINEAL